MKNRNGQNAARPVDFAQDKLEERPGRVSKDGGLLRWYLGVAGSVGVALGSCAAVALHAAVSQVVPHWNVHGWPSFGISVVAVLLNLVAATVLRVLDRRLEPGWFLVHGGLALAIAGALCGALFATRGKIVVHEGDGTDLVVDASGRPVAELPFRIVLSDFRLETGTPSLALVDTEETRMLMRKGDPIHELREGAKGELRGIRFEVLRYLPLAELDHDTERASSDSTAPPAALLRYRDRRDGIWRHGWITCGGTGIPTLTRPAVEARLAMSSPPPRAFRSEVTVVERGGKPRQEAIEVNRGIDVAGWTLQQLDYDRRAGKASSFSILEAVRDPFAPWVKAGIWIVVAGTAWFAAAMWRRPA